MLFRSAFVTGPERGNAKGVTRKGAGKGPLSVNSGGPWHGNRPLSVVNVFGVFGPVHAWFTSNAEGVIHVFRKT